MDQEKIGNFIKKIRTDNGLTQKEFAYKLGVTFQAVSKWENGKNIPDIGIIKSISEMFNVDVNEIISGEKIDKRNNKNKKYIYLLIIVFIIIGLVVVLKFVNYKDDFEFKTISSKCSDFKITGSAAYNKDKTAIFISNVEFCGNSKEIDNNEYKKMNCILYEEYNNTKTEISSCNAKSNIKLIEYLKDIKINVNNYSYTCSEFKKANLLLEIQAVSDDNKTITYKIPIKLENNC